MGMIGSLVYYSVLVCLFIELAIGDSPVPSDAPYPESAPPADELQNPPPIEKQVNFLSPQNDPLQSHPYSESEPPADKLQKPSPIKGKTKPKQSQPPELFPAEKLNVAPRSEESQTEPNDDKYGLAFWTELSKKGYLNYSSFIQPPEPEPAIFSDK